MHAAKNSIQDTKGRTCFCLEQGVHHEEEAEGGEVLLLLLSRFSHVRLWETP